LENLNAAREMSSNLQKEEIMSKILEINDNLHNLSNSLPNEWSYLINTELNAIKDKINQLAAINNTTNSYLSSQSNNITKEISTIVNQVTDIKKLIPRRTKNWKI
jgi:ACT domain-containing protein